MLVVGLGNPGPRYAGSPHNVGFRVVDRWAERHGIAPRASGAKPPAGAAGWAERFDAELCLASVGREELVLLKPMTFMNRSGQSVRQAMAFFEVDAEHALVVHDELDLPIGALKLKRGGGEAGHNGLKSVSAEIGTRDYCRLRVGVGRPASGEVRDYLLAPLGAAAAAELEASLAGAEAALDLWAAHGIEQAMNLVNRKAASDRLARSEGQPD